MGIGVIALGVFVGWITRFFVARLSSFSIKTMGALISVVLGGVVLNLFAGPAFDDLFWFYPIGLLIGFALGKWQDGR